MNDAITIDRTLAQWLVTLSLAASVLFGAVAWGLTSRFLPEFAPILRGLNLMMAFYLAYPAVRLLTTLSDRQSPPFFRWILSGAAGGFIAMVISVTLEFVGFME
jgi:hypothetical protein